MACRLSSRSTQWQVWPPVDPRGERGDLGRGAREMKYLVAEHLPSKPEKSCS